MEQFQLSYFSVPRARILLVMIFLVMADIIHLFSHPICVILTQPALRPLSKLSRVF